MSHSPAVHQRSRWAWIALIAVLGVETVAGVLGLIPLATGFFEASGEAPGQRLSILLAGVLAVLWVVITCLAAVRNRAGWVRGSALTLHVLLFAAGTGMLQYRLAPAGVAWAAVGLALVGFFAAILARPVVHEAGQDAVHDAVHEDEKLPNAEG